MIMMRIALELAQHDHTYESLAIKFSEALDAEYRACGVRVTAVCPGFTQTGFAAANGTQAIMDASPRRFFQTAEQVVAAAIRANDRGRVVVVPGWVAARVFSPKA